MPLEWLVRVAILDGSETEMQRALETAVAGAPAYVADGDWEFARVDGPEAADFPVLWHAFFHSQADAQGFAARVVAAFGKTKCRAGIPRRACPVHTVDPATLVCRDCGLCVANVSGFGPNPNPEPNPNVPAPHLDPEAATGTEREPETQPEPQPEATWADRFFFSPCVVS